MRQQFSEPLYRALPPGYEDKPFCPKGYCLKYKNLRGQVGPRSLFVTCWNPKTKKTQQEVWTGSKTSTIPPSGWQPAKPCSRKWSSEVKSEKLPRF